MLAGALVKLGPEVLFVGAGVGMALTALVAALQPTTWQPGAMTGEATAASREGVPEAA